MAPLARRWHVFFFPNVGRLQIVETAVKNVILSKGIKLLKHKLTT
jgi:hypothetical protein